MSETRERLKRNTRKQRLPRLLIRLEKKVESLSELLSGEGFNFPASANSFARELYERLPLGLQRKILKDTGFYLELLEKFKSSGGSLLDSRRLTWAFLKNSGLQPCSATFAQIEEFDLIEVFNSEHIQVFRNMRFFENYRGSLFDLCVLDWMSLFRRCSEIEEKLFLQMGSCFRQLARIRSFDKVPKHPVSLRFFPEETSMLIEPKFRSGLIKRQKASRPVEAVLVISKVESLKSSNSVKIYRVS